MSGKLLKSALKSVISDLPDDFAMKSQSVAPTLLKKGVKQEELHWSGFDIKDGKVTKQDLVELESKRKDKFNVVDGNGDYERYSLREARNNPTYREKVLTFNDEQNLESNRYKSVHFPDVPNYLAHTRVYDTTIDGSSTRVLMEIQSDLHQSGRRIGYQDSSKDELLEAQKRIQTELEEKAREYGVPEDVIEEGNYSIAEYQGLTREQSNTLESLTEEETEIFLQLDGSKGTIPVSPQQKTWLAKGIEREVVDAVEDGLQQISIPIKGYGVYDLQRAGGVQKWYETQVLNTAKKVAKRSGAEFELTKKTVKLISPDLTELGEMSDEELVSFIKTAREKDNAGKAENPEFSTLYGAVQFSLRGLLDSKNDKELADYIKTQYDDSFTTYATIKFSGKNLEPSEAVDDLMTRAQELESEIAYKANMEVFDYDEAMEAYKRGELNEEDLSMITERQKIMDEIDSVDMNQSRDSNYRHFKANKVNFNLYTSPAAGGFAVYTAYKSGYSESEITSQLEAQGKTNEEIEKFKSAAVKIGEAIEAGYSEDAIMQEMNKIYARAETAQNEPPKQWENEALAKWASGPTTARSASLNNLMSEEAKTAQELVTSMKVIKPILTSTYATDIGAFFGKQEARLRYEAARKRSRSQIIRLAKEKYDIDINWMPNGVGDEGWKVLNKDGTLEDITPTFWQDLNSAAGEIVGATGGAYLGYNAAPPVAPIVGPLSKPLGGAIGGIAGAVVGSELDYLRESVELQEEMEVQAAAFKALNAAEIAAVGEVLGYAGVKSLGLGWKSIVRAKDLLLDGNTEGAYMALKETALYSDEELKEIVHRLETVMEVPGKNDKEKAISAVALTESGMQDLVRAASSTDPIASKQVLSVIDKRAKSVLESTADISTPNASFRLIQDMSNYTADVKALYNKVKLKAVNSPKAENFSFNYEELAIDPILDRMYGKIFDPAVAERFLRQTQHIKDMTESRSFSDLIELRQITNDFLFNKKISKADDKKMLRGVVDRIDSMIKQSAPDVLDNPEQWLEDWAQARAQYSTMKKTQQTAMFRLVFDNKGNVKPVTPEAVTKAMTKHLTALDGNFDALLEKLPPNSRKMYEGAIIDTLARKYAVGYSSEKQAIHFPALAEDLNKLKFLSPEARSMKNALLEMSEIFKNELPLALTNSSFKVPAFQSYLTTDPVVRAQYELASGIFNYVKTLAPTKEQRSNALIRKTAQLLENPLNAKTANELIEEFRSDPEMLRQISQLQRDTAYAQARGSDSKSMKVQIFEGGKFKGTGDPIARIGRHRIASVEKIQEIADAEAISINSPMLDSLLKQYGYAAVENGTDRVRILK